MNKVEFTTNRGRVERMHPKLAELLARKGKGTYRTAAVQESPQRAVLTPEPPALPDHIEAPQEESSTSTDASPVEQTIDLASMSVEQLREHAKKQGVQVHHRAGATTIIKELEKASATPDTAPGVE